MHVRPVRERVFLLIPKFANPARYLQPNILKISRVYICQNTYSTNKVRTLFVLSPKDSSREFFNIFPLLLSCPVCCKSLSSPRKIILSERLIRNERIDKNLLLRSLIFLLLILRLARRSNREKAKACVLFLSLDFKESTMKEEKLHPVPTWSETFHSVYSHSRSLHREISRFSRFVAAAWATLGTGSLT